MLASLADSAARLSAWQILRSELTTGWPS